MYFFKISKTFKCLDLHCLRQRTLTQSDKGLANAMLKLVRLRSRTYTSWIISCLRQRFCVEIVPGKERKLLNQSEARKERECSRTESYSCLEGPIRNWSSNNPADTLRNNDVVITSKRCHFDVIASKWRRFDVMPTLLLRHVFSGNNTSHMSPKVRKLLNQERAAVVPKWCIVGYGICTWWDMWDWSIQWSVTKSSSCLRSRILNAPTNSEANPLNLSRLCGNRSVNRRPWNDGIQHSVTENNKIIMNAKRCQHYRPFRREIHRSLVKTCTLMWSFCLHVMQIRTVVLFSWALRSMESKEKMN